MPRQPRLDLPYVTQHVVQRGNDRRPCFFAEVDYERYRFDLREISMREGCEIHAYVLMTNHVHLLVTPTHTRLIARVMQALGRRYVRYVNERYHRTGTLWEGRYKACLVVHGADDRADVRDRDVQPAAVQPHGGDGRRRPFTGGGCFTTNPCTVTVTNTTTVTANFSLTP